LGVEGVKGDARRPTAEENAGASPKGRTLSFFPRHKNIRFLENRK